MKDVSKLVAWLVAGAHDTPAPQELMTGICERLVAAGIPLDRGGIFVLVLHPDIAGRSFVWHRGQPVEAGEAGYDVLESERFLSNPVVRVQRTGEGLRRRLVDAAVATEFPFLSKLREEGFTDYCATPLHFGNG